MSITLKERLDLLSAVCKAAQEALETNDLHGVEHNLSGIQWVVELTLATARPDIRKCLDEPEPEGWYYPDDEKEER